MEKPIAILLLALLVLPVLAGIGRIRRLPRDKPVSNEETPSDCVSRESD